MVTNSSTKIYLEATLSTPTQSDRSVTDGQSAMAFHQRNRSIPTLYILLENHPTFNVLCKTALLWNICTSDRTLHLSCNAVTLPINQVSDLPGYRQVGYHPKGITNILGIYNPADNGK